METVDYSQIQESRSAQEASAHRVLIVGGGAGGLELAARLGDTLGKRKKASIALLDRTRTHIWKPHLHEVASGALDVGVESVEYLGHAFRHHYRYRLGAMCGLNRLEKRVYVSAVQDEDGVELIPPRVLGYDTLVLAVGSVGNDFGTPGVKEHAIAIDSLEEASRFNRRMMNACIRANAQYGALRPGQLHCVIVGAGATGVELVAELHKSMRDLGIYGLDQIDLSQNVKLTLVEAGPRILGPLPERLAKGTLDLLTRLGVDVRTGQQVKEVTDKGVRLATGEFLDAEMVVWAAGIKAPAFLAGIDGLETDRINRLIVKPTLQATRDDNVFAIGDCASCTLEGHTAPLPPRAQTAHQMAKLMEKSVRARISGGKLPELKYRDFGSLVNLSEYGTVGSLEGMLGNKSLYLEGLFARLMYKSLYKMHQKALHGTVKMSLDTVANVVSGHAEPRIKLH